MADLAVVLESRTYKVPKYLQFSFEDLVQYCLDRIVATLVEDSGFSLLALAHTEWVVIDSDEAIRHFLFPSKCPLVYVWFPEHPRLLRVQTYNLAAFGHHKNWDARVNWLADVIAASNPDVLGLQEVRQVSLQQCRGLQKPLSIVKSIFTQFPAPGRSMLTELMERLPQYLFTHWEGAMNYRNGMVEGLAIVSRFPLAPTSLVPLYHSQRDRNDRICLFSTVQVPYVPLQFFNTHLRYDSEISVTLTGMAEDGRAIHLVHEGDKAFSTRRSIYALASNTWNATRCSEIDADPGAPGDPCTVEGSEIRCRVVKRP